jgi:hypothetical protein
MRMMQYPLKAIDSLVDRIVAVLAAVASSQLPGFIQHYTQRLGGHVVEAERNLEGWQEIANQTTKGNVVGLANIYLRSPDPEVVAAGQKCLGDLLRVETLQDAWTALEHASFWNRPFVFLRHVDGDIAEATLSRFTMNVPLDAESLVYALCGLVLGFLLYSGVKQAGLRTFRRRV